jgi:hypothetical protein
MLLVDVIIHKRKVEEGDSIFFERKCSLSFQERVRERFP